MERRSTTVRVITLNIWQEQGPWQARIDLTIERLSALQPDVICLQEVREVPDRIPNQAGTIAAALDMHHVYEVAQSWGGGGEGLAVLSRWRPQRCGYQELPYTEGRSRRLCLGAAVDSPAGELWVFTTHLAYRLEDGALRARQVRAADEFVRSRHSQGPLPAVLCGDFNAPPDADELRYLRGLTSIDGERTYYQDAFAVCNPGIDGHTWTHDNPYTDQLGWFPSRRLDYIFVTAERKNGSGRIRGARIVCTEPDARGVRCSDHYGVLADIELRATTTASR